MKTAVVTGSAGFLGRRFVAELERRGWGAYDFDVEETDRCTPFDCLSLFRASDDVFDLVVHCAARAPHRAAIDGQPATAVYNQLLDAAMFDWAIRTQQRRVLYLSSAAVYPVDMQHFAEVPRVLNERIIDLVYGFVGIPDAGYGWTKLAGERMAQAASEAGVPVHVVRPFSGYGDDQGEDWPFGAFVGRARRKEDPFAIWGDGSQVRDWIHVSDLVAGALAVVEAGVREPVNLCTGVGTSMAELAGMVCEAAGYRPSFVFRPDMPAGVAHRVGDPTRMREIYTPRVPLSEGVARAFGPPTREWTPSRSVRSAPLADGKPV